jgi:hypothetical protein
VSLTAARRTRSKISDQLSCSDSVAARLADIVTEQRRQANELALIRQLLEQRPPRHRQDPFADAVLMSTIARCFGSAVFNTTDLLRQAALDAELAAALDATDTRRIGARLKRLRGHAYGGYVLERVRRDEQGAIWCLTLAVSLVSHTAACHSGDRGA